jgi:hypothetical protein
VALAGTVFRFAQFPAFCRSREKPTSRKSGTRQRSWRLPVVDRSNPRKALGYLGRVSIMNARQGYHFEEEERARGFARDVVERVEITGEHSYSIILALEKD